MVKNLEILSLLLAIVGSVRAFNETTSFQVQIPQILYKPEGYEHRHSDFGFPEHAGVITEFVYYADSDLCELEKVNVHGGFPARKPIDGKDDGSAEPAWESPFILIADEGNCTYPTKARNAQILGAAALVVTYDVCICDDVDCLNKFGSQGCHEELPIMIGDGSEGDISIPSFLLNKVDSTTLIDHLKTNKSMQIEVGWGFTDTQHVNYTFFTSPHDYHGNQMLAMFKHMAVALGDSTTFMPHEYIHSGERYGCTHHEQEGGEETCKDICTNGGRYCAPNHYFHAQDASEMVPGKEIVKESLRRLCIWDQYGKDGTGVQYWNYVEQFTERCAAHPAYFTNTDCVSDAYTHSKIDGASIESCMEVSGSVDSNVGNNFLQQELDAQKKMGVVALPAIFINDKPLKGQINPWSVFYSICESFRGNWPDVCSKCMWQGELNECLGKGGDIQKPAEKKKKKRHGAKIFWITFFILAIAGGLGFWYYKRMRDERSSIIGDYMPFMSSQDGV